MILLDTNVISELMKTNRDSRVVDWIDRQRESDLLTSSVTIAEIRFGIALLPDSKRKTALDQRAEIVFGWLAGATVSFDALAARDYGSIAAGRRQQGRPISYHDAQIAAIARSAGLTLATRNKADFDGIENLKLVDPWQGKLPIGR
jgi:predicted nucleic acid-binding protein